MRDLISFLIIIVLSTTTYCASELYAQNKMKCGLANTILNGNQLQPAVSFLGDTGNFAIVWYQSNDQQVYFRRFDLFGKPIDSEEVLVVRDTLGEPLSTAVSGGLDVISLENGDFIITWRDNRNAQDPSSFSQDIYAQYVRFNGMLDGGNIRIDDGVINADVEGPRLALHHHDPLSSNQVTVALTWTDVRKEGFPLEEQDHDSVFIRFFTFMFNQNEPLEQAIFQSSKHVDKSEIRSNLLDLQNDIVNAPNGKFIVTWWWYTDSDIRYGTYTTSGDTITYSKDVAAILSPDANPSVSNFSDNGYIICWRGKDDQEDQHMYVQRFNALDEKVGNIIEIEDTDNVGGKSGISVFNDENYYDDYIVTFTRGTISDGDISGRLLKKNGTNITELDEEYWGEFSISSSAANERLPRIDTYNDKFVVVWNTQEMQYDVHYSLYSLDNGVPIIRKTDDDLDSNAVLYDLQMPAVRCTTEAYEVLDSRYITGLHEVNLFVTYDYSPYIAVCDSVDTLQMANYDDSLFAAYIDPDKYEIGTTVKYYTQIVDSALHIVFDPENYLRYPYAYYVSILGDINVNGLLDTHDLSLLCLYLNEELVFHPYEAFFADFQGDGDIDCWDYWALEDVAEPLPASYFVNPDCPYEFILPGPDELEMGVGYGAPNDIATIPLYLDNQGSEVKDAYYFLEYDSTVIELVGENTTSRTQGFSILPECCSPAPDIFITGGENIIEIGTGSILDLEFQVESGAQEGKYHITLTKGALNDSTNEAVVHPAYRGKIFIPAPPPVSIVCTPIGDTLLTPGDTLTFNTTLTNHSDSTKSPKFFIYGTTTGPDSFVFLAVDTTEIMQLPPGGRKRSITDLEVPQGAPQGHYIFTAYVSNNDATFDEDPFGFQIEGSSSKPGYGGDQLASSGRSMEPWKVLRGWFGYHERNKGKAETSASFPLPKSFSITQNYPNPFNPSTTIQYEVPDENTFSPVNVSVYDLRGRLIRTLVDEKKAPGIYQVHWDGKDNRDKRASSGVYLYRIIAGDFTSTRKMIIVR
jgi:hypothetical protein